MLSLTKVRLSRFTENLNKNNTTVKVRSENRKWIITDIKMSYVVEKCDRADNLKLYEYLSTMQLKESGDLEYLDIGTESKGYIYVLSLKCGGESKPPVTC